jgi:hypothetical protein
MDKKQVFIVFREDGDSYTSPTIMAVFSSQAAAEKVLKRFQKHPYQEFGWTADDYWVKGYWVDDYSVEEDEG